MAHISRDPATSELKTALQSIKLAGVREIWHLTSINCLELSRQRQLTVAAFEARCPSLNLVASPTSAMEVIAKIARFEWEILHIEQETRAQKNLENSGIAPRFLGHIHEHGRVMGFVLEKVEGRPAMIEDLSCCRSVLQRLHDHSLVHGDTNKYNFIVHDDKVLLISFEKSQFCPDDAESMQNEVESLRGQLMKETGRGGGLRFVEESCEET